MTCVMEDYSYDQLMIWNFTKRCYIFFPSKILSSIIKWGGGGIPKALTLMKSHQLQAEFGRCSEDDNSNWYEICKLSGYIVRIYCSYRTALYKDSIN
jgi:hypothetical protein